MAIIKNEFDILEGAFLGPDGEIKEDIAKIFQRVDFLAHLYRSDDGNFLKLTDGKEIPGFSDEAGAYIYVRYAGESRTEGKTLKVPLRCVLIYPGAVNMQNIAYFIYANLLINTKGHMLTDGGIKLNMQEIFTEETGKDEKDLRNDISSAAIDFSLHFAAPVHCVDAGAEFSINSKTCC